MMKLIMPRSARLFSVLSLAIATTVAGIAGIGLAEETRRPRPDKGPPVARDERPDAPHDRRRGGPLTPQEITLAFEVMERIDPDTAQAFRLRYEENPDDTLRKQLRLHVREQIGALAQPDDIRFTAAVPKTRSGKIMRRLLRDIAAGKEATGDTSTLEDSSVLAKLRDDED